MIEDRREQIEDRYFALFNSTFLSYIQQFRFAPINHISTLKVCNSSALYTYMLKSHASYTHIASSIKFVLNNKRIAICMPHDKSHIQEATKHAPSPICDLFVRCIHYMMGLVLYYNVNAFALNIQNAFAVTQYVLYA